MNENYPMNPNPNPGMAGSGRNAMYAGGMAGS